jgi:hypothetical protein
MSLNGWDALFCVGLDILQASGGFATPQAPWIEGRNSFCDALRFQIASLRLAPGGAGSEVLFLASFVDGSTITILGEARPLGGASVTIKGDINLLPNTNSISLQASGHMVGDERILVQDLQASQSLDELKREAVCMALGVALHQQAGFLTLSIAEIFPKFDNGQWPAIGQLRCAYDDQAKAMSVFVCKDTQRIRTLAALLPGGLQTAGSQGTLALSNDVFWTNCVIPAFAPVMASDPGAAIPDGDGQMKIPGNRQLPTITKLNTAFRPRLTSLTLKESAPGLDFTVNGTCDMRVDVDMRFRGSGTFGIGVDRQSGEVRFDRQGDIDFSHDLDLSWAEEIALGVLLGGEVTAFVALLQGQIASSIGSSLQSAVAGSLAAKIVEWNAQTPIAYTSFHWNDEAVIEISNGGK